MDPVWRAVWASANICKRTMCLNWMNLYRPYLTTLQNSSQHKAENYLNMLTKFQQIEFVYLPKPACRPPGIAAAFSSLNWNENVNVPVCTNNKYFIYSSLRETSAGQLSISTCIRIPSRTTNRLLRTAPGTQRSPSEMKCLAAKQTSMSVHHKFITSATFIKLQRKKTSLVILKACYENLQNCSWTV